jgi:3-hydroxyacyl-[acyl-carrier-protein] dehydratase
MTNEEIISKTLLKPFLFVDEIKGNQWKQVEGHFTFDENLDFIRVILNIISDTGVILTETMAQIGLVCLGIFILDNNFTKNTSIA